MSTLQLRRAMESNLDRYKQDIDALIRRGDQLHNAIQANCYPAEFRAQLKNVSDSKAEAVLRALPSFTETYQSWYSEARALVKQILPDRLEDFASHYERPKQRKEITSESYRISDYLQGLSVTRGWEKEKVVGPEAAIPHFRQQLA